VSIWLDLKIEKEFEYEIQTKTNMDIIQAYIVRYCINIVAAIVTVGVSQPSPLTEISTQDLEGEWF
jgi:hypothetical protein